MAPFNGGEISPGPSVETDEQILDWVARDAETALHPSCTAKMGTDAMSVTDPQTMGVHGIEGLKVVDASVMPYVTNGNIYAPVMMVAEKAADLILGNQPLPPAAVPFYRHQPRAAGERPGNSPPRLSAPAVVSCRGRCAASEHDHRAQHFAAVHGRERLLDLIQLDALADEGGAQFRCPLQLFRVAVDGDDRRRAGQPGPAIAASAHPDEVADLDMGDRGPGRLNDACRLVAQQEREVVVDAAVAVGQIGMTHPACLDPHHHVVRARIRDVDLGEFDGRTFAAGDDALDLLWHVKTSQFGAWTAGTIRRTVCDN